jgi:hypothetical protein
MFSITSASSPVLSNAPHAEATAATASNGHSEPETQTITSTDIEDSATKLIRTDSSSSSELTEANTTYGADPTCTLSTQVLDQDFAKEEAEASLSSSPQLISGLLKPDCTQLLLPSQIGPLKDVASAGLESCEDVEEMRIVPAPVLSTPLIINGVIKTSYGGVQQQPQHPSNKAAAASDWLSGLFAGRAKKQQMAVQQLTASPRTPPGAEEVGSSQSGQSSPLSFVPFNEKTFQSHLEERGRAMEAQASTRGPSEPYYR